VFLLFLSISSFTKADSLPVILPTLLTSDFKIKQATSELASARFFIDQKNADWLPQLNLKISEGWENVFVANRGVTDLQRREWGLSFTQLITDFGMTSGSVEVANVKFTKKKIDLQAIKQKVIFSGIKAYLEIYRLKEQLRYAQLSEKNIKKQTGMEEARVQRGSGFSTDVLQSKSKLANAFARTARAQGELAKAINNFTTLYQFAPKVLTDFNLPDAPVKFLPETINQTIAIAQEFNTAIIQAKFDVNIAQADITAARSKHFPTIAFNADIIHRHNDYGQFGDKEEYRVGIDLNMPIFSGGRDQAGLDQSYADLNAKKDKSLDVQRDVEKKVRNAWQDLQTDQLNAHYLRNSATISEEFLVLARQERKLGRRSLIDVLSEENSYINALEAAVSAETSVFISSYRLLEAMGILNQHMVTSKI